MKTEITIDERGLTLTSMAQRDAAVQALKAQLTRKITEDFCELLTRGGRHG